MKIKDFLTEGTKPRGGDYIKHEDMSWWKGDQSRSNIHVVGSKIKVGDKPYQKIDTTGGQWIYAGTGSMTRDVYHASNLKDSGEKYLGKTVWVVV